MQSNDFFLKWKFHEKLTSLITFQENVPIDTHLPEHLKTQDAYELLRSATELDPPLNKADEVSMHCIHVIRSNNTIQPNRTGHLICYYIDGIMGSR